MLCGERGRRPIRMGKVSLTYPSPEGSNLVSLHAQTLLLAATIGCALLVLELAQSVIRPQAPSTLSCVCRRAGVERF